MYSMGKLLSDECCPGYSDVDTSRFHASVHATCLSNCVLRVRHAERHAPPRVVFPHVADATTGEFGKLRVSGRKVSPKMFNSCSEFQPPSAHLVRQRLARLSGEVPPHGSYGIPDLGPMATAMLRASACCIEIHKRRTPAPASQTFVTHVVRPNLRPVGC